MLNCIAVGLGGFLGSVCRYLAGQIPLGRDWGFPVRTLAINLIGSFSSARHGAGPEAGRPRPQAGALPEAGVCGGFTTFSSFALETGDLLQSGRTAAALLYAAALAGLRHPVLWPAPEDTGALCSCPVTVQAFPPPLRSWPGRGEHLSAFT